jgi:hypothetical protein
LKAQLSDQIANRLTNQLNRNFSFYDDWFDPMIGLRARYDLNKASYLTAETMSAGLASDLTSLCRFMPHRAAKLHAAYVPEAGYRYYYDDFRGESVNGFLYQLSIHGAQVTVGLTF